MSSLDHKKSILEKKYLSYLRQITDDNRLMEALDVVKNEFLSTEAFLPSSLIFGDVVPVCVICNDLRRLLPSGTRTLP